MTRCPGATPDNLDSVLVACPACGREVEIFTDEPKHRCRCGTMVFREAQPRCADWCAAAAQCFAGHIDVQELERRLAEIKNDPYAKRYVGDIQKRIEAIRGERAGG